MIERSSAARPARRGWERPGLPGGTPGEDWLSPLPGANQAHYEAAVRELNTAYAMMSIALDEAVQLRLQSNLGAARDQARFATQLLERLQFRMIRTIEALGEFGAAPHLARPDVPEVNPINPTFFRHPEGRRVAIWHGCLHWVLYGARLRYLHKVRALEEMVLQLAVHFRESATDLADGTCVQPLESWESLELLHHDLNTCLQEVIVLLKSLFHSLAAADALALSERLSPEAAAPPTRLEGVSAHLR